MSIKPIILILALSATSCNPCSLVDCLELYPTIKFSYLSISNADMLDGPSKKYDLTDIRVYSIDNSGNKINAYLLLYTQPYGSASYIAASLECETKRSLLEIKGKVTDTLDFVVNKNPPNGCCPNTIQITKVFLNNVENGENILTIKERL